MYQTANSVIASYDKLVDMLESIDQFLNCLDIYTKIPLTVAITEMVAKILAELLSTLALAIKHIKQGTEGRPGESVFTSNWVLPDSMQRREVRKILGGERHQRGSPKAGPIHSGRGSDNCSADP